jgi:MFS family permease
VGVANVGPVFALYAGLVLVVRIFGAKLPDILGWRRGSSLALLGVATGAGVTGLWASSLAVWLGAVALGVGMSLLFPALFTAVVGTSPEGERTHAIGTFTLFFDLSQGVGAAFVGGVVSLTSERAGFIAAAICAVVGLAAQRALRTRIANGLSDQLGAAIK